MFRENQMQRISGPDSIMNSAYQSILEEYEAIRLTVKAWLK